MNMLYFRMASRILVSGIILMICFNAAYAQVKITGAVNDSNNQPVAGVSVLAQKSGTTVSTNPSGGYEISVSDESDILIFSHVGYETAKEIVGKRQVVNVMLNSTDQNIDEVVIIGYGTSTTRDLTGSVTRMGGDKIRETAANNFAEALQGRMAGVRVNAQSGEPGAAMSIQIRGANSINASSAPLYIIDGLQIDDNSGEVAASEVGSTSSNPLATINPNDIESIDVLKDASATAIYGARGANGVIIITTKSGRGVSSSLTVDSRVGFSDVAKRLDMLTAQEFADYRFAWDPTNPNNPFAATNENDEIIGPRDVSDRESFNWQDLILRTGVTQNHNVSVSNAAEKTNYSFNLGYLNQQGIITSNDFKRYSGQAKFRHKFSDRLTVDGSMNYGRTVSDGAVNSGGSAGAFSSFTQSLYTFSPVDVFIPGEDNDVDSAGFIPLTSMFYNSYKNTTMDRLIGGAGLVFEIVPKLTLRSNLAVNTSTSEVNEFYGRETLWGNSVGGRGHVGNVKTTAVTQSNVLNYDTRFHDNTINAILGQEINTYNFRSSRFGANGFDDESTGMFDIRKGSVILQPVNNYYATNRLSFFGRVNYNYKSKYYLTATMRADGSSNFGAGNRFAYFPSGAAAWRASDERFFEPIRSVVNELKFRASVGVTGNDRIPAYAALSRLSPKQYSGGGVNMFGMVPSTSPNPDLKWEETIQFDAGVDIGFLANRINVTADVYRKNTDNLLLNALVASQTGFPQQMQNIGKISNRGFELTINSENIKKEYFSWSTNINFDINRNKVESLGTVDFIPIDFGNGFIPQVGRVMAGEPIGTGFGFIADGNYQLADFYITNNNTGALVDPSLINNQNYSEHSYALKENQPTVAGVTTVQPGFRKYVDQNGDGVVDEEDRVPISNSNPKFSLGFGNEFTYKNVSLSFFLEAVYGQQIVNMFTNAVEAAGSGTLAPAYNLTQDYWHNRWTPENPTNTYSVVRSLTNNFMSSYFVEDGSFLRFRNLSLTYRMNNAFTKKAGMKGLRLNFTADNLFLWTNYSGVDPDIRSLNPLLAGHDRSSYPRARTYFFGLIADF